MFRKREKENGFRISRMISGFPLPDFDFDEPDETAFDMLGSDHCITEYERQEIEKILELAIDWTNPLRCTKNSAVYLACGSDNNWAVKITDNKKRVEEEYQKRMAIPDVVSLVKTVRIASIATQSMLQMELCEFGDITQFKFETKGDLLSMMYYVALGLHVIHENGWMHLDVSPSNILLADDTFKLADFGTLIRVGEFTEGCEGAGPYVSPEALQFPSGPYSVGTATDIFSFGLVCLEAATGVLAPRGGSSAYVKLRQGKIGIGSGKYQCKWDAEIQSLIASMLRVNPMERPTAAQIMETVKRL